MKLSIKARVTLLCIIMAAVIAGFAIAILFAGEQYIVRDYYRESLAATVSLAGDDIYWKDGKLEIDRNLDDMPNVGISIFNADGDLLYGRAYFDLPFEDGAFRNAGGPGASLWYVRDALLEPEGGSGVWFRCYISADAADSVDGGLGRLFIWIFVLIVVAAGFGGWLIAGRAFRPVKRIIGTAESIIDGADLKKRIAPTGVRDEMYELASTFDAMFQRLEGAFERERRFTSDVSHELRTPVTAILSQSDFALSDAADEADRSEALQEIRDRSKDMASLISKLLVLARMDAGQQPMDRETVDLGELAQISAESFEDRALEKEMTIVVRTQDNIRVEGDRTMIAQAALNLVENAVRYGKRGGCIEIEVSENRGTAALSVSDDGPGIAADDIPHLFERFYQADASRRSEGAGLGLSLVDRIMAIHGGRVTVASHPGLGSCFKLIFPAKGGNA